MKDREQASAAGAAPKKPWVDPEIREQSARSLTAFSFKSLAPIEPSPFIGNPS